MEDELTGPMVLSPKTKRTLREIILIIIALASAAPAAAAHLPKDAIVANILIVAGIVTHYAGPVEKLLPFLADSGSTTPDPAPEGEHAK